MRLLTSLILIGWLLMPATTTAQEVKKVVVGKSAPDFEVTGIDGKKFKLSSKIGKKNVVLMFSRAYW